MSGWRRRAAVGSLVAAMTFGLRDAPALVGGGPPVVVDHEGDPPELEPVTLFFHPEVPEATLVLVR